MEIKIRIPTKAEPGRALELSVIAFSPGGRFLAASNLQDETATLPVRDEDAQNIRLFVVPASKAKNPAILTTEKLERMGAWEPMFRYDSTLPEQVLTSIPPDIASAFIIRNCRVRGRVVKPETVGGIRSRYPICHARVRIYEVTPVRKAVLNLSDAATVRLRDDLLAVITGKVRFPLDPGDPPPDVFLAAASAASPRDPASLAELPPDIPAKARAAFSLDDPRAIRHWIAEEVQYFLPYLCPLLYYDRLDLTEITVVETDEFGRFDLSFTYSSADQPDLYFEVEYPLDGVWTAVYQPPVVCGTRWNYACGTEVTLEVTHPHVPHCGTPPRLRGPHIGIVAIGQTINVSRIPQTGPNCGYFDPQTETDRIPHPFAGVIEPYIIFGDAFGSAATHYQWSWKRLTNPAGEPVTDDEHPIADEVSRAYSVVEDRNVVVRRLQLGPDPSVTARPAFQIPPENAPSGGRWELENVRRDRASAHFQTGRAGGPDPVNAAGLYELRLKLFRSTGPGAIALYEAGPDTFQVPRPDESAPFIGVENRLVPAPRENRDGFAFVLKIWIDNNPVTAAILPPSVGAPSADRCGCGFISYPAADAPVRLEFQALHPRNQADFSFSIHKGTSGPIGTVSGQTGHAPTPGDPGSSFHYDGTSRRYVSDARLVASRLLGCCPRAAFALSLSVIPRAVDGWPNGPVPSAAAVPVAFALEPVVSRSGS